MVNEPVGAGLADVVPVDVVPIAAPGFVPVGGGGGGNGACGGGAFVGCVGLVVVDVLGVVGCVGGAVGVIGGVVGCVVVVDPLVRCPVGGEVGCCPVGGGGGGNCGRPSGGGACGVPSVRGTTNAFCCTLVRSVFRSITSDNDVRETISKSRPVSEF